MRDRRMIGVLGIVCMVLGMVFMAFYTEATAQSKPVVIGGITPLTGPAGGQGVSIKMGADMAVEEYNAKGGILGGRKVVIKWEDDKAIPTEGVSAMKKFIADGIRLFTGGFSSSVILAEIPVAKENGCILVNATGMHPKTAGDGTSFSMIASIPVMHGRHMDSVVAKFKPKTAYIISENTEYGRGVHETVKKKLVESEVKILGEAFPENTEMEFRTLLTKVKSLNPDIMMVCFPPVAGCVAIWEQSMEVGIRDRLVMTWQMLGDQINLAPRHVCDGIWGTTLWTPNLPNALTKKFVSDYMKKYGVKEPEVSDYAATGWQAVVVLIEAVKKVGTETNVEAIRKAIWETDIEGLWGRLRFDPAWGRPYYNPIEFVVKNKGYQVLAK